MRDYGKIEVPFWSWARRNKLSDRAKLLAVYLLTNRFSNSVGVYELLVDDVSTDLKWDFETVKETLSELSSNNLSEPFAYYCETVEYVFIRDHMSHNPPANGNVGKAMCKIIDAIPRKFTYWHELIEKLKPFDNRLPKGFVNGLEKRFRNQEQKQEQKQEEDSSSDVSDQSDQVDQGQMDFSSEECSIDDPPFLPHPPTQTEDSQSEDLLDIPENLLRNEDMEFDKFWKTYPRKVSKGQARKAFKAALKKVRFPVLMDGVRAYAAKVERDGTDAKYIKHPPTWLNGECWSDEDASGGGSQGQASGLHPDAGQNQWIGRLQGFKDKNLWLDSWGPSPTEPGCECPKNILAEFGYGEER